MHADGNWVDSLIQMQFEVSFGFCAYSKKKKKAKGKKFDSLSLEVWILPSIWTEAGHAGSVYL